MLSERFRCAWAARWLPRVLGGAVLASGMIASTAIDPQGLVAWSGRARTAVWIASAALALLVVRGGAVLRRFVELDTDGMAVGEGTHALRLPYREIADVRLVGPFASGRAWAPTIEVRDRAGRLWPVPAALRDGERFVDRVLAEVADDELTAWVEARGVRSRLVWARVVVAVGYAVAATLLLGAVVWSRS